MKYKTAIFDFDGTLMDTSKGIIECVEKVVKELNILVPLHANYNKLIGPPLKVAFMNVFELDEKNAEEMVCVYREIYKKTGMLEAHIYEGISELLIDLNMAEIKCVIASVKRQNVVMQTLEYFSMTKYFSAVCGAKSMNSVVNKIDIIEDALSLTNSLKEESLMIGDSHYDSEGAKAVGLDFCGVLWGFGYDSPSEVKDCKYIAKDVDELRKIFEL